MSIKSRAPKNLTLELESNLVQDNVPAEVVPGIYIGSIHAAFNHEALHELGITHILNASRLPSTFPKSFTYLTIDIRDKEDANILACIPASNIFIEAGVDNGGVLVHCYGGRSRSVTFIAAFLMSSMHISLDHALQLIQQARHVASVNAGFKQQLLAYSMAEYDVYVAQQILLQDRIKALQQYRQHRNGEPPLHHHKRPFSDEPCNIRKHIPLMEAKTPRCRLSRPGTTAVRVIPPLRGLERIYCCSWCGCNLFNLGNVIRGDIPLPAARLPTVRADAKYDYKSERPEKKLTMEAPSPREIGIALQADEKRSGSIAKQSSKKFDFDFDDVTATPPVVKKEKFASPKDYLSPKAVMEESPRIPMPPAGVGNRPPSAEKRRWLARVNLLKGEGSDCKVNTMAERDVRAMDLNLGKEKYIHLEYLEWMGDEILHGAKDRGELCCGQCKRVIGNWDWAPTNRQMQTRILEPPIIRIHKNVVHEVDMQLDQTPANTPRIEDEPDRMDVISHLERKSG